MTAPELTPDVLDAVADWLGTYLADPDPRHLDLMRQHAAQLREEKAEDERLGALVYEVSNRDNPHEFSRIQNSVRNQCIAIGRAVQADTIKRQKTAALGQDPWPPYKQPTMGDLRDLGEQLVWHQQNSPTGVTGIAQIALSRVNRLYELRLRDEPLDDELPVF